MEPNLLTETVAFKPKNPVEIKTCSEITIKEFLDFLKTAYQVQESLEGVLIANGMTDAIDWLKLKESQFVQKNETAMQTVEQECQTLSNSDVASKKSEKSILEAKLSEVLSEGILDPILSNLPSASFHSCHSKKSSVSKISDKSSVSTVASSSSSGSAHPKKRPSESAISIRPALLAEKPSSQIEIHVCDEAKGARKDFLCNQKLLVEKMGYFADVTAGQRLEDMDISVHCDIGIFEWLMRWVQRDTLLEADWPQLDAANVTPILVSASFLKMEPLLDDCLAFCHANLNEILKTNANFACLNDSILKRLAAMYTNEELEAVKDKKDKLQSKLFAKLIQSLVENVSSESIRGHWNSLARVFRCEKCQQLVAPSVMHKVPCEPARMRLQCDGTIVSRHVRDPAWNINDYVASLHRKLKTWRRVYWRLWGDAHFLYCLTCRRYFPASRLGWCLYHPDAPQFFTLDAQKAPLPVGRYPCCGDRAYRFHLLANYRGCKFREHVACERSPRDAAVLQLLLAYRALVVEEPPELMFPERLTRLVARDTRVTDGLVCKETFWWDGLEIVPERPRLGLLHAFARRGDEPRASTETSDASDTDESDSGSSSEEERVAPASPPQRRKKRGAAEHKLWQVHLSARSNQDAQRAYEERAIKQISNAIGKKVASDVAAKTKRFATKNAHAGGIWVRLEQEWREQNAIAGKRGGAPAAKSRARNQRF